MHYVSRDFRSPDTTWSLFDISFFVKYEEGFDAVLCAGNRHVATNFRTTFEHLVVRGKKDDERSGTVLGVHNERTRLSVWIILLCILSSAGPEARCWNQIKARYLFSGHIFAHLDTNRRILEAATRRRR